MNTDINDYLIIENLVDYLHIYLTQFIEVTVNNNNNNNNNNKFTDKSGDLYIKVINTISDNTNIKDNKSYYYLLDSAGSLAVWFNTEDKNTLTDKDFPITFLKKLMKYYKYEFKL